MSGSRRRAACETIDALPHVLNRGGLGIVSPIDVVLGSPLPAEGPGVVQIDGEASRPITRSTARMAIDDRRQIEDLPENARAPVARNRPRPQAARMGLGRSAY